MSSKEKSSAVAGSGAASVPKLRFPEFEESDGWKEIPLQKLARPVTDRATTGDADNVLSLSGEHGLVLQSEYFGKKIAGDSTDRYLKIRKDDFVYNDRTTKASSFGTIKRLSAHEGGIVSPIYKCFRFQSSEKPAFWEWYFESGSHDPALGGLVNEGARAGRFNISVTQFLSTNAWRPDEDEQQKIADCLDSADALIAAQGRKVEALRAHKKGLMQQLFPQEGETQPRLRFPEFEGADEWESTILGRLSEVVRGGSPRPIDGFLTTATDGLNWLKIGDVDKESKYVTKTADKVRREALSKTRVVNPGDLILSNSMSFGRPFILKISTCIHDGWIAVRKIETKVIRDFLYYFILSPGSQAYFVGNAAGSGVQNLNADIIKSLPIQFPGRAEQEAIAGTLASLDDLIAAEVKRLDMLKTHKNVNPSAGDLAQAG
jgi:type I restriction enzyme S subunit